MPDGEAVRAPSTPSEAEPAPGETIHATCVVVDEAGVLIRGPSGSGKSTLARELMATAQLQGRFARLVSDDRTRVAARHGRLVADAVAATAGRMEARGVGILAVPYEPRAVVRLAIELSTEEPPRLPGPGEDVASLCGVSVSCIRARFEPALAPLVLAHLSDAGRARGHSRVTA